MSISKPNRLLVNARVAGFIIIAVLMLMVAGCTKNYGRFAKSAEVDIAFRQGDQQSEYQYFYSGRDTMPYAIIGIDRGYSVPSQYWVPFEPESEQFRKMTGNMSGKLRYAPAGYHILDPDGNIIGVWFSSVDHKSVSVDQQNRTVELLFQKPENRGGGR
jgi:hypothetical protein